MTLARLAARAPGRRTSTGDGRAAARSRGPVPAVIVVLAVILGAAIAAAQPAAAAAAAPTTALDCRPGYQYAMTTSSSGSTRPSLRYGQLVQVAPNGVVTSIGSQLTSLTGILLGAQWDGLGISSDGSTGYVFQDTRGQQNLGIWKYTASTGKWSDTGGQITVGTGTSILAGAVDPITGNYLVGGYSTTSTGTFMIWSYNPGARSSSYLGYVPVAAGYDAGDIAFDGQGNLHILTASSTSASAREYVVTADRIYSSAGAAMASSGTAASTFLRGATGFSFDSNGRAYASVGKEMWRADTPPFRNVTRVTSSLASAQTSSDDLASCSYPPVISLRSEVKGRTHPGDQFRLAMSTQAVGSGTSVEFSNSTTAGSSDGVQPEIVGPYPSIRGARIVFAQTPAGTTDPSSYDTSYLCRSADGTVLVSGSGTSGTLTYPASGASVACTITSTPRASLTVSKVWNVDGKAYPDGTQPDGLSSTLGVTPAGSPAGAPAWGQTRTGFRMGDQVAVTETTAIDQTALPGCTISSATIAGDGIDGAAALGDPTTVTLPAVSNSLTITDTVQCQKLTIVTAVGNSHGGDRQPQDWDGRLHATPAGGAAQTFDSGQTRNVPAGQFTLDEDQWPGYDMTGLTCTGGALTGSTVTVPKGASVTCTMTNADEPGAVTWRVADSLGRPLPGSTWVLTGPGGASVSVADCDAGQASACTGPDKDPAAGAFTVGGLSWGGWSLTSSTAPPGYLLDADAHPFTLTADRLSHSFDTTFDAAQRTPITLPSTGGTGADPFLLGGAALVTAGGTAAVASRLRKRAGGARRKTP